MTARVEIRLVVGDVRASRRPAVLRTLLGSCVSACLWDPEERVGGMNHFLLPGDAQSGDSARFGVHAMELLICELQGLGAKRHRLSGKIFGGGKMAGISGSVSAKNIGFIEEFMRVEGIPVLGRDLGGTLPRHVLFLSDTGQVFVKTVKGKRQLEKTAGEARRLLAAPAPVYGEIVLFGDEPAAGGAS